MRELLRMMLKLNMHSVISFWYMSKLTFYMYIMYKEFT